jgi:very-short-patch-repair endonuclease
MALKLSEPQIWLVDYLCARYDKEDVHTEYQFCERKWRFDVALVGAKHYAFEVEGGIHTAGAHVRGKHYESDMEKYNVAAALGWKVFRFTPKQILTGTAKAFIEKYL